MIELNHNKRTRTAGKAQHLTSRAIDGYATTCQPPTMATRSRLLEDVPIGFDGRMLIPQGTGVSTYARGLEQAIARLTEHPLVVRASHQDDGAMRRILGAIPGRKRIERGDGVVIGRDVFRRGHLHFSLFGRPLHLILPGRPGIMHWTYPVPLLIEGWANLYTVHDAIPLVAPALSSISPERHRRVLTALDRSAARFVTVSEAARREIVATTGLSVDRVHDAGQAVIVGAPSGGPLPEGIRPGEYFLFCGTIEPRKNLVRLLAAHAQSGTELPLVIVGPDGWRAGPIRAAIAAAPRALHLGFQDREALLRLIASARALLFPSLAEGFGLPVVEAMALGTPVLTSARGALQEIAGGAAVLVDPIDPAAMASGILRLAKDDAYRHALVAAGLRRAADFPLERFVTRLASLYEEIVKTDPIFLKDL
jgi:glycosyltransferase involved in cell wall biosynthesis